MTAAQNKALHAWGKAHGFAHRDLAPLCGVVSLKDLTVDAAAAALERLNADRPIVGPVCNRSKRRLPRLKPGTIRPATPAQRKYLADLVARIGDPRRISGWESWGIRDIAGGAYTTTAASHAITQLQQYLYKAGDRDQGIEKSRAAHA